VKSFIQGSVLVAGPRGEGVGVLGGGRILLWAPLEACDVRVLRCMPEEIKELPT
jgi:hypothetical protein